MSSTQGVPFASLYTTHNSVHVKVLHSLLQGLSNLSKHNKKFLEEVVINTTKINMFEKMLDLYFSRRRLLI
jgi:hypothetical protein